MKKFLLVPAIFPCFLFSILAKRRKVGGQAVIEGVMMRGRDNVSWAVRKNERDVVVERREFISASKKHKILSRPVLRGAVNLFESLVLGYRALTRSAEIVEEELNRTAKEEGKPVKKKSRAGEQLASGVSLAVSLLIVFGVFMYLPMWVLSQIVPKESALLSTRLPVSCGLSFFSYILFSSVSGRRSGAYSSTMARSIWRFSPMKRGRI